MKAQVVCLVRSGPDEVTFTWSQGPDSFPAYQLTGQHVIDLEERVEAVRRRLWELTRSYSAYLTTPDEPPSVADLLAACAALAAAGHELKEWVFEPTENPEVTAEVGGWLT